MANTPEEHAYEAVLGTLAFSFLISSALFGLNYTKWRIEINRDISWHRNDAVNEFIINCTKKPSDCKFLLKAIQQQ